MSMFTSDYQKEHLDSRLDFTPNLYRYKKVEKAFIETCKRYDIEYSHDCTAFENTFFKTVNYTTYANMFMMHPLNFDLSFSQVLHGLADDCKPKDYISNIALQKEKTGGKYRANFIKKGREDVNSVVVLPGSNKFDKHVCTRKLKRIVELDKKSVVKPHPLTDANLMSRLRELVPSNQLADSMEDLYDLINACKIVYTTHISETALTGLALGKEVEPIDVMEYRNSGSFSHINYYLYTSLDPIKEMNKILSSPKSGIICLDMDKDWESKMEEYFKFIMAKRAKEKGRYIYGHVTDTIIRPCNL